MNQCGQLYHQNISWIQSFLILLPLFSSSFQPLPSPVWVPAVAFHLDSLLLLLSLYVQKHKAEQATRLRALQGLPITLRPKSELLTVANQDPSDLIAAHWSDFIVNVLLFSTQVTPLWPFAMPWKFQAPFLPQGPHTSYSLGGKHSSYWSVYGSWPPFVPGFFSNVTSAVKKSRLIKMEY